MKEFFKLKTWLITLIIVCLSISFSTFLVYRQFKEDIKVAKAGTGDNVSGWAWNENIGWISFNCTNDSSCGTSNYGVNINLTTGDFSGYAWSENIGWIDFGPTSGYPEAPTTPAHYDRVSGAVTGWAKILTLGDDGWMKMSGTWSDGVTIDAATGDFRGWAWNGNGEGSGIGWVSFNCINDSSCGVSNYKVVGAVNRAPQAINLAAPNWNYTQASASGALNSYLRWEFNDSDPGSSESAYQVIFDDDNDPASPIFDTGKCTGYVAPPSLCKINLGVDRYPVTSTHLNYNTRYYWWIKVWDNYDLASNLKAYDTTPDTDNDDANVPTFTTYLHEFPDVDFTWFPQDPSKAEKVKMTDASSIYETAAPSTPLACNDARCDWLWTPPPGDTIDNPTIATPTITFNSAGTKTVTLKVTDVNGYYTILSKQINVKAGLPVWKEVKPR